MTQSLLFYDDYVLTLSIDSCFLWDLRDFSQKRKLSVQNQQVKFQSGLFCGADYSKILTVFKDQSIFVWDAKNMTKQFKVNSVKNHIEHIKASAISPNGEELALAGSEPESPENDLNSKFAELAETRNSTSPNSGPGRRICIFNLVSGQLDQILEIPSIASDISQIFYISKKFNTQGYSPTVGILCKNGSCIFVNTTTGHEVGRLGGHAPDQTYKIHYPSFDGSKIASINLESKIDVYKTEFALPNILGLAAAPLVKVVGKLWKNKAVASRDQTHDNRNDILIKNRDMREDVVVHDGLSEQRKFSLDWVYFAFDTFI